jgi:hypothetical protein
VERLRTTPDERRQAGADSISAIRPQAPFAVGLTDQPVAVASKTRRSGASSSSISTAK